MKKWCNLVFSLCLLAALTGGAQDKAKRQAKAKHDRKRPDMMTQADLNGDGKIDEAEAEQFAQTRIEGIKKRVQAVIGKFDTDGDGALSQAEIAKMKNTIAEKGGRDPSKMLKMIDKDGDFNISAEEEEAATVAFVNRLKQAGKKKEPKQRKAQMPVDPDTNADGIVDEQEARAASESQLERIRRQLEGLKKRMEKNPNLKVPPYMKNIDKDGDGTLSDEEATAFVEYQMGTYEKRNEAVLKIFDDNQDGLLDAAELNALVKAKAFIKASAKIRQPQRPQKRGGKAGKKAPAAH